MNRKSVLARVRAAEANGMSASRIGYLTVGDPSFVPKLRNGHPFRVSTLLRAYAALDLLGNSGSRRAAPRKRRAR